ncbi:MAG: hypothetical protein FWG55_01725 [Candidatus Bathyarchaeota archaeon]|nr:hypothetical protein [Candidatus Termiticorpusculum sp.]
MSTVNKALALVFVFIVLASLMALTIKPADAQTVSKPSVPQFTVQLVDYSYDVPPSTTTTIDQYTGEKTTTTTPGYRVENKTIEITIKTQPFTSYTGTNGSTYYLYYTVQSKGRFGEDWQNWGSTVQIKNPYGGGFWPSPEYSQGSIVSGSANGYTNGAQVDFRVEAIIGHYVPDSPDHMFPQYWFETDASSGWSSVQTVTIDRDSFYHSTPNSTTSPTPLPASSPQASTYYSSTKKTVTTVPYSMITFLVCAIGLLIGIIVALVVLLLRKHPKADDLQPQQS